MYSSRSRSPCLHFRIGQLKYTVDRSINITCGGTPELCWRNPRFPENPGLKTTAIITLILYRISLESAKSRKKWEKSLLNST